MAKRGEGEGGRWVERETGEGRKGRSREGEKGWPRRQADGRSGNRALRKEEDWNRRIEIWK